MNVPQWFKTFGLVVIISGLMAVGLNACGGDQATPAPATSPAGSQVTATVGQVGSNAAVASPPTVSSHANPDQPGVKTGTGNSSVAGDLPIYPGSKQVNTSQAQSGSAQVSTTYYTTQDKTDDVYKWATPAFQDKGWTLTTSASDASAQAYVLNGTRPGKSLVLTILGPQARSQTKYAEFFQKTGVGPNDSLVFVVVTGA